MNSSHARRSPQLVAALNGLLVVALLAACQPSEAPFTVDVLFQDAQGVEPGDEVHFKGLEIGEVTHVGINGQGAVAVTIEVDAEHSGALATNSKIEIERAGLLGGRQLTVRDGEGDRQPLRSGDQITGVQGPVSTALASLRELSTEALQRLQGAGEGLQERLSQAAADPEQPEQDGSEIQIELGRLAAALESVREQSRNATSEENRAALKQRAEEFEQQLGVLREKLKSETEDLKQQLGPLLHDVESWWSEFTSGEEGSG